MWFRRFFLTLSFVLLAACFSSTGPSFAAGKPVTVGDFAVRLARSLGFAVATPAEALERLGGIGISLGPDAGAPLKQAQAMDFARGMGLAVGSASDPSAVLTGPAADLLARVASEAILSTPGPPGFKGSIPSSCTLLGQGQCFSCCVASLLGYSAVPQRVISICNASCAAISGQMGSSPSGP
jgi:hypothetical protein